MKKYLLSEIRFEGAFFQGFVAMYLSCYASVTSPHNSGTQSRQFSSTQARFWKLDLANHPNQAVSQTQEYGSDGRSAAMGARRVKEFEELKMQAIMHPRHETEIAGYAC
jgi:hypothetical protein